MTELVSLTNLNEISNPMFTCNETITYLEYKKNLDARTTVKEFNLEKLISYIVDD